MHNARRRRTTLLLMVLCAEAYPVVKEPEYKHFQAQGPFAISPHLSGLFEKVVPDQRQRNREIDAVRQVVNRLFPLGFHRWTAEVKLYVLCGIVRRIVADGWNPSRLSELEASFVFRLYQMTDNIVLKQPPEYVERFVIEAPALLRAEGMFGNN